MAFKTSLIHTIEKPEKPIYIYGLCDPDTNELKYIGLSTTGFKRLVNHYKCCYRKSKGGFYSASQNWIRNLKLQNKIFEPIYFQYFDADGPHVDEAEQFWIGYFKMIGSNLLNHDNGGRFKYLRFNSSEAKYKQSQTAKRINGTPEKKEFFRNHTTETWKDPEIRARRMEGLKNQPPKSKEHCQKVKEAVTKTCGTHVEDDKGNFFPSLAECARFYNVGMEVISRILYAKTRKYSHIKIKRVGGAGLPPSEHKIDKYYIKKGRIKKPYVRQVIDGNGQIYQNVLEASQKLNLHVGQAYKLLRDVQKATRSGVTLKWYGK